MAIEFTKEMIEGARDTERQTGVPSSITLGQLVLESGYKNPSSLSGLAKNYNNYFGVKATKNWTGRTTTMNNKAGNDLATYKVYSSASESFLDHAKILTLPRYTQFYKNADSVNDYAIALQKGGYATDPLYSMKLTNIIKSNNLTQYDLTSNYLYDDNANFEVSYRTSESTMNLDSNNIETEQTGFFDDSFWKGILKTIIYAISFLLIVVFTFICLMKTFDIQINPIQKMIK